MREGWEQNVFSNVFDLQMGKTPDRKSPEMFEGDNVWVTISDLNDKYVSESKEHISDDAASKIKIVKKGTVIMSFKLSVGKTAIASKDLYTNEAIMAFNVNEGYNINNNFLYYYLSGYNWEGGNRAVMGMTLNKATISKQIIFIPPLSTQQSIVSELDSLSQIIADCKETLKDYDALEQSIFYDMFGDPVKNDKGWEVKKLGEMCKVGTGSTPDRKNERFYEGYIPWVKSTEVCNLVINNTQEHISQEAYDSSNCSLYPKGSILMAMYGQGKTRGQVGILGIEACTNQAVAAIILPDNIATTFLFVQLQLMYNYIRGMANGCNQTNLNVGIVKSIVIICPHLPLQQQFASKIEAIEQMKEETKKALQEAETLFQARMDYWFN